MKKVTFVAMAIMLGLSINLLADENELTGDRKTACEVLLCLSSGERPSECDPALRHFYSIKDKKPWKTLQKRKKFLELCPTNSGNTATNIIMADYKGMLASVNPDECKPEYLNNRLQDYKKIVEYKNLKGKTYKSEVTYVRINPNIPSHCPVLINHEYTDYKMPKYNCDGKYYEASAFNRGYELISITLQEYNQLQPNQRHHQRYTYSCGGERERTCTKDNYYKKITIPKTCWSY